MTNNSKIHLFYDDECALCSRFKDSLQFLCKSEKYQYHPISSIAEDDEFAHLNTEELLDTVHILNENNEWLKGADAVQYLVAECPKVESFKWLIESEAGKKASQIFYKASDTIRKKIKGSCKSCDCQ